MTSGGWMVRLPPISDLHVEPPLEPILLLEFAVEVAADALRARLVARAGDLPADEIDEVTMARVLARECDQLLETLGDYRRRVLARLARDLGE